MEGGQSSEDDRNAQGMVTRGTLTGTRRHPPTIAASAAVLMLAACPRAAEYNNDTVWEVKTATADVSYLKVEEVEVWRRGRFVRDFQWNRHRCLLVPCRGGRGFGGVSFAGS